MNVPFHKEILQVKDPDEFPVMLVGNKADLDSQGIVRKTLDYSIKWIFSNAHENSICL